jgi:hypothetical protein
VNTPTPHQSTPENVDAQRSATSTAPPHFIHTTPTATPLVRGGVSTATPAKTTTSESQRGRTLFAVATNIGTPQCALPHDQHRTGIPPLHGARYRDGEHSRDHTTNAGRHSHSMYGNTSRCSASRWGPPPYRRQSSLRCASTAASTPPGFAACSPAQQSTHDGRVTGSSDSARHTRGQNATTTARNPAHVLIGCAARRNAQCARADRRRARHTHTT